MGLSPSKKLKNAIVKTFFSHGPFVVEVFKPKL